jgi:ammonia channel protein AmtB
MTKEILDARELTSEKEIPYAPVVWRYGLILAGISIAFMLIQTLTGMQWTSWVSFIVLIGGLVYALREHRDKDLGGYVSFGRAFAVTTLVGLLSSTVGGIFNYVYINFINPNAADAALEQAREQYEKLGMAEEQIDQSMEMAKSMMTSPTGFLLTMVAALIFTAIITLIISLIMKRERPLFQ